MLFQIFLVSLIILAVFLQASDHKLKGYISPLLPIGVGIWTLCSSIFGTNIPLLGISCGSALILVGLSDFILDLNKDRLFPIGMGLGLLSGLILAVIFHIVAFQNSIKISFYLLGWVIAIIVSIPVRLLLSPPKEFQIPILIYLMQIIMLLSGGLAAGIVGNYYFMSWAILLFLSDSLVGIRQFPSEKFKIPGLTQERILLLILLIYYTALYIMSLWASYNF